MENTKIETTKTTVIIENNLLTKIRKKQSELMLKEDRDVTFTEILNIVLKEALGD